MRNFRDYGRRLLFSQGKVLVCCAAASGCLGSTAFAQSAPAADSASDQSNSLQEVVVTSTRTSEVLSKVPISVEVFTQKQMESQGVKQFSDIVRLTPGLSVNQSANSGGNDINIRGVSSRAGASTTGVYIDDTPIQVRQVGYAAGTLFPVLFDLDRVEVLRGPQGTLFGSGSEGGTVRFIQPTPSLTSYSGNARAEGAQTSGGDSSYEAGGAFGGPIIDNKLGFRASAYFRHDGGYIDTGPANFTLNDQTHKGVGYGDAITVTPAGRIDKNVNSSNSIAFRGALKWAATDNLTVSPSVFYQHITLESGDNSFWLGASDPKNDDYFTPRFAPGNATPGGLTQLHLPLGTDGENSMGVYSLAVQWDFGFASLYSNTSYLDEKKSQLTDQTTYYSVTAVDQFSQPFPNPGQNANNIYDDSQKVWTEEIRLQSADKTARFNWVVGGFFSRSHYISYQYSEDNIWSSTTTWFGGPIPANRDPFGPGHSSFENTWGAPLVDDSGTYIADARTVERQIAGFGQVDFKITPKLSLTAGIRVSKNKLDYSLITSGVENNLNAPFGSPCPTGPVCPYNNGGAFAPSFPIGQVNNNESPKTPKVGLNFQATDDNLVYASATKGFRPGGAQITLPSGCNNDLRLAGYVDANGNPQSPLTYKSDSVWSYEVGSKNRMADGRFTASGSLYEIKWKDIQTNIGLPGCGYALVDNVGSATIKGFDLSLGVVPLPGLNLDAAVGYTHTSLDDGLYQPNGTAVLTKGAAIVNAGAPWNVVVSGQYDFALAAEYDAYFRADYTWNAQWDRTAQTDSGTFNYDPLLPPRPSTNLVNTRFGIRHASMDLSLFINNLMDEHPLIINGHGSPKYIWEATTFRPRTIGLTLSYRFN